MTTVYFVRHAQSQFWRVIEDSQRPLSDEGLQDRKLVLDFLRDKPVDAFYCSPYRRSLDTIGPAAEYFHMEIATDPRFGERVPGEGGNNQDYFRRRWADFDFHEPGGECLRSVQNRNIAALFDLLDANEGRTLVLGTHGTALSTMLNYFNPAFGVEDFLRIVDWMPWILEARFQGHELLSLTEGAHIYKEFRPR